MSGDFMAATGPIHTEVVFIVSAGRLLVNNGFGGLSIKPWWGVVQNDPH